MFYWRVDSRGLSIVAVSINGRSYGSSRSSVLRVPISIGFVLTDHSHLKTDLFAVGNVKTTCGVTFLR